MAFRSLSWMNASPGAGIGDAERADPAPLDKLNQTRQYLLALPSCQWATLNADDRQKAISFIINELLDHTPPLARHATVRALAGRLPGSFSGVILEVLSSLP